MNHSIEECLIKKDMPLFHHETDCLEQINEQKVFSWTHEEINEFAKTLTPYNEGN
tara:strand:+ start:172 stop:336 length:165 start_codon:yes stop_codon:yes gene_type:complete